MKRSRIAFAAAAFVAAVLFLGTVSAQAQSIGASGGTAVANESGATENAGVMGVSFATGKFLGISLVGDLQASFDPDNSTTIFAVGIRKPLKYGFDGTLGVGTGQVTDGRQSVVLAPSIGYQRTVGGGIAFRAEVNGNFLPGVNVLTVRTSIGLVYALDK